MFLIAWETCTLSTRRPGLALEYSTLFSFLTIGRWQEGGEINERKKRIEKEYLWGGVGGGGFCHLWSMVSQENAKRLNKITPTNAGASGTITGT